MKESLGRGFLIIAQGKPRYIHMAKQLAISLELSNPGIPRALVTDSSDPELANLFDLLIPIDSSLGVGFIQKVNMYNYSPFERTMFIDADCLAGRDLDFLWKLFEGQTVSVIGRKVHEGDLLGRKVHELKQELKVDYLLSFNGGVYYFEKGPKAESVFQSAMDIFLNSYEKLRLIKFSGRPGDEPAMSVAMAIHKIEPVNDNWRGMYTPVGQSGEFRIDILKGECDFFKGGQKVSPAIMHFGGGYPEAFHYRRETFKLRLVYYFRFPKTLASAITNLTWNPLYISYVFFYRILKKLAKGGNFKLRPLMPMFRFE